MVFSANPDAGRGFAAVVFYTVLFGPLILIASVVMSWVELRYLVSGVTADAQVVRIYEVDDYRRNTVGSYRVEYRFTEGGGGGVVRSEEDTVRSLDGWPFKNNRAVVTVEYLPGVEDRSRLSGHRRLWVAIPLVVTVVVLAGAVIKAALMYRADVREGRRGRK